MLFSFTPRFLASAVREASLLGSTRSVSNSFARVRPHGDGLALERLRDEESLTVLLPGDAADLPAEGVVFDWVDFVALVKTLGRDTTTGHADLSPDGAAVVFTVDTLALPLALREDSRPVDTGHLVPVAIFDTDTFTTALAATMRATCSPDDLHPLLETVSLTLEGSAATMYGTDRYRLARYTLPTLQTLITDPVRLKIPTSKALTHLSKILPGTLTLEAVLDDDIHSGNVGIRLTGAHGKTLTLRAIPGTYPDLTRLCNEARNDWFTVNRTALLEILKRALTYAKSTKGNTRRHANHLDTLTLTIADGHLTATIGHAPTAATFGECPVDHHHTGTFNLNPQFIYDAIDTHTDDTLTIRGATTHDALTPTKPVSIEGTHTQNLTTLVMPIRG